ncbi:MAG TPA: hypothetical protein VEY12_03315 [Thermoplasmata archaeon]|nr:hypothetical protein [Thermoplasmata archaeon]
MTTLIRSDAPRRSAMAAIAIGGLVIGGLWFSALAIFLALQAASGVYPNDVNVYTALFLGMVFVCATVAVDIYRREFMPDELIHKIRRPKIVPPRTFR